ncbi:MAG: triose-phosphate isomerase [Gemmatimonadota bacterium]
MTALRRPLMAANWKMHFTAGEAARYLEAFFAGAPSDSAREVVFFVPAALLAESCAAATGRAAAVGAQNIHWEDRGAFTGETSAPMVSAAGASHCLVGHSERRQLFHEDDATIRRKLLAALRNGLHPLLCVGERIAERRGGGARETVVRQLLGALEGLAAADLEPLSVAYEPVWAIGTGETATPDVAAEMHAHVRDALRQLAGDALARGTRILYGGSVTPANVDQLMARPEIDGVLVGGASLDPAAFRRIVDFDASG